DRGRDQSGSRLREAWPFGHGQRARAEHRRIAVLHHRSRRSEPRRQRYDLRRGDRGLRGGEEDLSRGSDRLAPERAHHDQEDQHRATMKTTKTQRTKAKAKPKVKAKPNRMPLPDRLAKRQVKKTPPNAPAKKPP